MEKLRECPFCGGKPMFISNTLLEATRIVCEVCEASVRYYENKYGDLACDRATRAWNRRAGEETTNETDR